MAICANFTWRGVTISSAYIRIDYVYGGKRVPKVVPDRPYESYWVGNVGVYSEETQEEPFYTTAVSVPYVAEESPYPLLYAVVKAMPEVINPVDC